MKGMIPGIRNLYRTWNPIPINHGEVAKRNLPIWSVGTAYCMHDYRRDQGRRLNVIGWNRLCYLEKEAVIIAIDALPMICTLLTLNREQTNLIQNPAMRLRKRINRGTQARERSHRTIRKAQNIELSVESWIEKRALINESPTSPRAKLPLANPILLA